MGQRLKAVRQRLGIVQLGNLDQQRIAGFERIGHLGPAPQRRARQGMDGAEQITILALRAINAPQGRVGGQGGRRGQPPSDRRQQQYQQADTALPKKARHCRRVAAMPWAPSWSSRLPLPARWPAPTAINSTCGLAGSAAAMRALTHCVQLRLRSSNSF